MTERARERAPASDAAPGADSAWERYPDGLLKTRIGELQFECGYPSVTTVELLYDELDFQRACQVFLWALPVVSMAQLQHALSETFGAQDCDLVQNVGYDSKRGILTGNVSTPSVGLFPNLTRTGPLAIEIPAGPVSGVVTDFWQRPIAELGLTGRDGGRASKYLVIGPDTPASGASGFACVRSPTNNLMIWLRVLSADPAESQSLLDHFHVYPHARRRNPPLRRVFDAGSKRWFGMPPRGMAYWERLHDILQAEPIEERDRFFTAMLRPLGLEKGKPFFPGEVEQAILTEAALVGEAMAKANNYKKRMEGVRLWSGRRWENAVCCEPSQRGDHYDQLDERAAWFYETIGTFSGMSAPTPGVGQIYLSSYKDRHGNWLDGGVHYRLVVPPYVPVRQFWSFTVYDNDTRAILENPSRRADISSRDNVELEPDGSAILYFGPTAPAASERNWIETIPGRGWFTYFRLFAPTEPYFDTSWQLPDIEPVS
jgi:hypothetical protein